MKLLHTADWHLGKRLDHISRLDEQRAVLREICDIADREAVDAVLIAGDLFDTSNPPVEATELLYTTLHRLAAGGKRPVIGIAGNHDSPDRIEAPDPLARACGIVLAGYPDSHIKPFALETGVGIVHTEAGFVEMSLRNAAGETEHLRLLLTPYANELRLKKMLAGNAAAKDGGAGEDATAEKAAALRDMLQARWADIAARYCDDKGVNILMAHLFVMRRGGETPQESDDERSILSIGGASEVWSENLPKGVQYVALGHLHRNQVIDSAPCPVVYCGSPLSYSMSEAGQQKYVTIVEASPGAPAQIRHVPLTQGRTLARKTFASVTAAVDWLQANPHTLVELTMVSETYLTASERKALADAHDGIVTIIPQVQAAAKGSEAAKPTVDLSQDMESLFGEYFLAKHKQAPNERLLSLFREVMAVEE